MFKKMIAVLLSLAVAMSFGVTAFAAESEATVPAPVKAGMVGDEGVMPMSGTFSIPFSNLGINHYIAYGGTFSLNGNEKLGYKASWTPTTQEIKIGVRNINTGEIYDKVIYGGNADSTLNLSTDPSRKVPAGQYQVVVINPYGASSTVSGNINFEWK